MLFVDLDFKTVPRRPPPQALQQLSRRQTQFNNIRPSISVSAPLVHCPSASCTCRQCQPWLLQWQPGQLPTLPSRPLISPMSVPIYHRVAMPNGPYNIYNPNMPSSASFAPLPLQPPLTQPGFSSIDGNGIGSRHSTRKSIATEASPPLAPPKKKPTKSGKKRGRGNVRRACVECRKSHTRCTDNRPCRRCISRGVVCQELGEDRRRKRRKKSLITPTSSGSNPSISSDTFDGSLSDNISKTSTTTTTTRIVTTTTTAKKDNGSISSIQKNQIVSSICESQDIPECFRDHRDNKH